jgi:hypothetical protein
MNDIYSILYLLTPLNRNENENEAAEAQQYYDQQKIDHE